MPGYWPASICFFSASPFGPPAISTSVGTQSSEAKMSFLTVPGLMTPGQRITIGARMPPSQVVSLPPLNGVMPPSGKVLVSAPLSVVKTTMVLLVWPMCFDLLKNEADVVVHLLHAGFVDAPVLAAGLTDHGMYLSDSTVVMCMRAGLYQTKNGLLVRRGSLRSRKSMTLAEISSSTVFDRSSVSGPSSLHVWFFELPSDLHASTGRGGVRQIVVLDPRRPGPRAGRGSACSCTVARRSAALAFC